MAATILNLPAEETRRAVHAPYPEAVNKQFSVLVRSFVCIIVLSPLATISCNKNGSVRHRHAFSPYTLALFMKQILNSNYFVYNVVFLSWFNVVA